MKQQVKYQLKWAYLVAVALVASFNLEMQVKAQPIHYKNIQSSDNPINSLHSNTSARELFRKAYENRYTWNSNFPGYTAKVELKLGKKDYKGRVRVNRDMSVEVADINNKDARQIVENQLGIIAVHRRRVPFEAAHKNNTFKFGKIDKTNNYVEIIEQGDKEAEAYYKLSDQKIMQVNRLLGPHSVTVNVLNTEVTPQGYLATRYQTIFRQPQTKQVLLEEESKDFYKKVGEYYVLSHQVLHGSEEGQPIDTELKFSDIQLLPSK